MNNDAMSNIPTRKAPRDFVEIDEFWPADEHWPQTFFEQSIWVYVDEYRAELTGDEDYSRIIIHSSADKGWLYSRGLSDKQGVLEVLNKITTPVSQAQLKNLGFVAWKGSYI
jgi:hypothetical protein